MQTPTNNRPSTFQLRSSDNICKKAIFVEKTKGTEGNHRCFQLRSSDNICSNKKHKANIRCSAPKQRIEMTGWNQHWFIIFRNRMQSISRAGNLIIRLYISVRCTFRILITFPRLQRWRCYAPKSMCKFDNMNNLQMAKVKQQWMFSAA